jgi:hypothetical protein
MAILTMAVEAGQPAHVAPHVHAACTMRRRTSYRTRTAACAHVHCRCTSSTSTARRTLARVPNPNPNPNQVHIVYGTEDTSNAELLSHYGFVDRGASARLSLRRRLTLPPTLTLTLTPTSTPTLTLTLTPTSTMTLTL